MVITYIIDFQYTPILSVSDVLYNADTVTVTVEWTQHEGVMYTARVSPSTPIITTGYTSRQVTISYNTKYNLTVEAAPVCRPNSTTSVLLHYGEIIIVATITAQEIIIILLFQFCIAKCETPEMLFILEFQNDTVPIARVVSFDVGMTPVEGTTVMFSCPPGFSLSGSNSATCTENGKWEPDQRGIMTLCHNLTFNQGGLICNDSKG